MTNDKLYKILSGITQIDTKQNQLIGTLSSTIGTGFNTTDLTVAKVIDAEIKQRQADHKVISGNIDYISGQIDEVSGNVITETTRATGAEDYISGQVDVVSGNVIAETTRATGAEDYISGQVDDLRDETITLSGTLADEVSFISSAIGYGYDATNTVSAAIEEAKKAAVSSISGLEAIEVTGDNTGKTIKLNLADNSGLAQSAAGLYTTLKISKLAEPTSGYAASYQLQDVSGHVFGDTIDIVKDQFLKDVSFISKATEADVTEAAAAGQTIEQGKPYIKLTFYCGEAESKKVWIDVSSLVDTYTGESGVAVNGYKISGVVDTANTESFLQLTTDGFKVVGVSGFVTDTVDAAKTALAADITYISGQVDVVSGNVDTISGNLDAEIIRAKGAEETLSTMIDELDLSTVGGEGKVITSVWQTNGLVSATCIDLTADKVTYGTGTVSGALDTINGDKTVEGSISYKIDQYDQELSGILTEVDKIKTEMGI